MKFWFYVIKVSWRISMGRWYVWRDVPTDIVRQVAVLWFLNRKSKEEKSDLIYEAHKEYQLRKRKEKQS
jgi:hypothetical protein